MPNYQVSMAAQHRNKPSKMIQFYRAVCQPSRFYRNLIFYGSRLLLLQSILLADTPSERTTGLLFNVDFHFLTCPRFSHENGQLCSGLLLSVLQMTQLRRPRTKKKDNSICEMSSSQKNTIVCFLYLLLLSYKSEKECKFMKKWLQSGQKKDTKSVGWAKISKFLKKF